MEEGERTDATDIEPEDATPEDDVEAPEPAEPDSEHAVEDTEDQA